MGLKVGLDPVTEQKLRDFAVRRYRLIVLRGICSAVVSVLAVLTTIAAMDWLWVIPDTVRWTLTLSGYGLSALVVWITSLRLMARLPSQKQLARLVEATEPTLREDLISAVELGAREDANLDSPVFRQLLQNSVADRMRGLQITHLLPWRLVMGWTAATAGILLICAILVSMPGFPFRTLLVRAALPGANVARVSDVSVKILEPRPLSPTVPQGDPVSVVVEVGHAEPAMLQKIGAVVIETDHPTEGRRRFNMIERTSHQFGTNVLVGREPLRYRIHAGDAVTEWNTIASRPRPQVAVFQKTLTYPEYSRLEKQTLREKDGHLRALEGTHVELLLELDQPATGRLEFDLGDKKPVLELTPAGPGRLTAQLPIQASGTYKVHLVSTETGFENTFSPNHEITALPDLVPRVEITQPRQNLLAPPDEIISLRGSAEDDLALASVEQWVRVNDGNWQRLPLVADIGAQTPIAVNWDLVGLRLKTGDRVTTKLVATDLKGSRGESAPLQITVIASGFEAQRQAVLSGKLQVLAALDRLNTTAEQSMKDSREAMTRINENPDNFLQVRLYASNLAEAVDRLNSEADRARDQMLQVLRTLPAGLDSHDLVLLGQALVAVRHGTLSLASAEVSAAMADGDSVRRRERLDLARQQVEKARNESKRLSEQYERLMAGEIITVATHSLTALHLEQRRLKESAPASEDPAVSLRRLARGQAVTAGQMRLVEETLGYFESRFDQGLSRHFDLVVARQLSERRQILEQVLAEALPAEHSHLPSGPQLSPWHTVGPFSEDNYEKAFQRSYDPEKFVDLNKTYGPEQLKWEQKPEWIDAQPHVLRGENSAFYLFRTITVSREQDLDVSLGSDDGIRVFLNGRRVLSNNVQRGVAPDQERLKLKLKPGQNNLLIKIVNGGSDGGFYFRAEGVSVPEALQKLGSPLERLRAVGDQVQERVEWALRELKGAQRNSLDRERNARRELARTGETLGKAMEQLVREIPVQDDALRRDRLLRWRWPAVVEQLKAGGAFEEARTDGDARYIADRGHAARTLQMLLERHQISAQPDDAAMAARVGELTRAFSQLKVVHEVHQLAGHADFLREEERWKQRSVGASVMHPLVWRHLRHEMPESSQDIRRTGLPAQAADLLGQIPGKPYGGQVNQEMEQRLHELGLTRPVQDPVYLVHRDLQQVLKLLEEAAEEARRKLQELAPTLPEMMRALAMKAQALSDQTQTAAEKAAEKEARDNRSRIQELARNQAELARPLNDILDALRQDASLQDPLTEAGRQRARDDDDAIAMLRDPERKAAEAIENASRGQTAADQTRDLSEASQEQEKLAQTLQQLADHFEKLNQGQDVADSRQALRDAEQALGIKESLDQEYARLEQLAELSQQQDPQALLAALEQELQNNRAMQRELDALTRDAVQQAKESLEQAARREDQVAQQLQNAAQQQGSQQQNLQQQMQQLQKGLEQLAKESVPKTSEQARQAGAQDAAQPIQQAQQQADQALNQGRTSPETSPQEAAQKLAQITAPLNQAAQQLDQAAQAAQKPTPNQQQAQQNAQQQAQNAQQAQQKAQQAQQEAQKAQQQAQQKAQQAQQAAESAKNAQAAADQAKQAADGQPDNADLKQAADSAARQAQQAQARSQEAAQQAQSAQQEAQKAAAAQQQAQQQAQSAQQAAQQAQQQAQAAQQAAQAAAQRAQQAAAEARQLAQQAQQIAQQLAQTQSQGQQALTQAASEQAPIAQQVGEVAQTLARAARHEDRLGNESASQSLEQAARNTGALAQDQLPQASQQIASAATAQAAQPTAQAAASAIREQAQALGSESSEASGAEAEGQPAGGSPESASASSSPAGSSPSSSSPFAGQSAEQLARALDMADRMVNSPGSPAPAPPGAAPASPLSSPLAAAAAAQAASMRQARSSGQTPGQSPTSEGLAQRSEQGADIHGPLGAGNVNLPDAAARGAAEWGKLPPKMARDLLEGRRESVAGPYRSSVETYFRVLADQAREQKDR